MVTVDQIEAARRRLPPEVVRTPLLPCPALGGETPTYLKAENLQVFGSHLQVRKPLFV